MEDQAPAGIINIRKLLRIQSGIFIAVAVIGFVIINSNNYEVKDFLDLNPNGVFFFLAVGVGLEYLSLLLCQRNENIRSLIALISVPAIVLNLHFGILGIALIIGWIYCVYLLYQPEGKEWFNRPPEPIDLNKHTDHFIALGSICGIALLIAFWFIGSEEVADFVRRIQREMEIKKLARH